MTTYVMRIDNKDKYFFLGNNGSLIAEETVDATTVDHLMKFYEKHNNPYLVDIKSLSFGNLVADDDDEDELDVSVVENKGRNDYYVVKHQYDDSVYVTKNGTFYFNDTDTSNLDADSYSVKVKLDYRGEEEILNLPRQCLFNIAIEAEEGIIKFVRNKDNDFSIEEANAAFEIIGVDIVRN